VITIFGQCSRTRLYRLTQLHKMFKLVLPHTTSNWPTRKAPITLSDTRPSFQAFLLLNHESSFFFFLSPPDDLLAESCGCLALASDCDMAPSFCLRISSVRPLPLCVAYVHDWPCVKHASVNGLTKQHFAPFLNSLWHCFVAHSGARNVSCFVTIDRWIHTLNVRMLLSWKAEFWRSFNASCVCVPHMLPMAAILTAVNAGYFRFRQQRNHVCQLDRRESLVTEWATITWIIRCS